MSLTSVQEVFTALLREWGVPNVQVNEVVPLDSVFDQPPYVSIIHYTS